MKKSIAIFLSAAMIAGLMSACGAKTEETMVSTEAATESMAESMQETEATMAEETEVKTGVKTGLGIISTIKSSKDAAEENGLARVDSTVAAVLLDEDGKILACDIDVAQTKIDFSKEGKILTDLTGEFKTKKEIGADYGMKSASGIQKEWDEQAMALEEYVVGKTIDEVKAIPVDEKTVPTAEDLTASVTIKIGSYLKALDKAVENAKVLGATKDDKLGLAVITDVSDSKDVAGTDDGVVSVYNDYAVITLSADNKVTSSYIDAAQIDVKFNAEGKITSDLEAEWQTKQEMGESYGMKAVSPIGKEWFEQADAFAMYVVGKQADELAVIEMDEKGLAKDADLVSSVTVHVSPLIAIVDKAAKNAMK